MTTLEQCTALEDAVERLIDAHGLYAIVQAIEIVCHGKADHLAHSWQDYNAAKRWLLASNVFDRAYASLRTLRMEG